MHDNSEFVRGFGDVWGALFTAYSGGQALGLLSVFGAVLFVGGCVYLVWTIFSLLRRVRKDAKSG